MRFARTVFRIAGIWGVLTLTPLYFMFHLIGRNDPPPLTHPGFFYGFLGAALAWQLAFFVVATDPVRYRPIMIPSILEKFSYGARLRPRLRWSRPAALCSVCRGLLQDANMYRLASNRISGQDMRMQAPRRSRPGARSLQRFPVGLEGSRPRHPHPERS